jgi:hypothetical protein
MQVALAERWTGARRRVLHARPADVTGPSGFPALLTTGGVSPKLASLKQGRALIRLSLRCSAVPQRPAGHAAPVAVGTLWVGSPTSLSC